MSASLDLVALSLLPLWWRREIGEQLRAGVNPTRLLEGLLDRRGELHTAPTVRARAARVTRQARGADLATVLWGDPAYPPRLAAIFDPPPVLWVRGHASALLRPAVAIVGSRAGTAYARAVAERLAGDLSARGIAVVSGLARGVDSAAHRGALGGAGSTLAVLGSGADVVYPPEHAALAAEIAKQGAVLSELAPGTRPRPGFFPMRNRIISGLSNAVVIVEAGDRSGSLITARCALDQGRDVLAVPGNVLSGRNRGGHALLRDGAKIVETADDIIEELDPGLRDPASAGSASKGAGTAVHDAVLAALPAGEACDLDAIAAQTGLPAVRLLARLFELELQGLVGRAGGGRFVRIDRSC
jgi:DNA processing protein